MGTTLQIRLKPATLERLGLPDISYPIELDKLESTLSEENLPFAVMLFGLQQLSNEQVRNWQVLEPAMARLSELIHPQDSPDTTSVAGDNWWLQLGAVDLTGRIVTIQREQHLIAAITKRDDGRLNAAVYRPLDRKSAEYLVGLSVNPHPEGGVCMRENNWEYALDASAGMGNFYAFEAGDAHLSYWEKGIGIRRDDSVDDDWRKQVNLTPRPVARVAIELGIHYTLSDE